jgi:hypothetical protein
LIRGIPFALFFLWEGSVSYDQVNIGLYRCDDDVSGAGARPAGGDTAQKCAKHPGINLFVVSDFSLFLPFLPPRPSRLFVCHLLWRFRGDMSRTFPPGQLVVIRIDVDSL